MEMWWWRENNRNVVVVVVVVEYNRNVVVVVVEENYRILMAFKPISMLNMLPFSQTTFCSCGVDMSWFSSVCEKSFSRKDGMQRHLMSKHCNAFQTVPMYSQKCQRLRFQHPFTSMIAGTTGSGKIE